MEIGLVGFFFEDDGFIVEMEIEKLAEMRAMAMFLYPEPTMENILQHKEQLRFWLPQIESMPSEVQYCAMLNILWLINHKIVEPDDQNGVIVVIEGNVYETGDDLN